MIARARTGVARLLEDLAQFTLPQRCPGCGAPADPRRFLCPGCLAAIPRLSFALCARCLVRGREPVGCRAHPGHAVWPAWVYDERAELLVHALKYEERSDLAAGLADEMARGAAVPRPDLIVEVPLHPARRRERGYNQAERLARALAERIGAPHLPGALVRIRPTATQTRLDPRVRRANVTGAFRVVNPAWLEGRNVLIVDDVVTTGSTLEACLDVLAAAGARAAAHTLAWAQ